MTGSRVRSRRLGAILATALLGIALIPGLASAANTRSIYLGSPDAQVNSGILLPTAVSVPGASAPVNSTLVPVQVKSADNQTIAHTILKVNWNPTGNAGLSLNNYYDPASGNTNKPSNCSDAGTVITCDYGNLPGFAVRTLNVIVDVAASYSGSAAGLFTAQANTNNENGTNQQEFLASSGSFAVSAFNANSVNTFVPPGQAKQLFTSAVGGAGGDVSTNVSFKSAGEIVTIREGTSSATDYPCPAGFSCQPSFAEVTTTSGFFSTSPFFTWTLTAIVPKTYSTSQGFIAHYATGALTPNWTLLFKDKSAACGTNVAAKIASAHQCISVLTLTKLDKTSNLLTVTVVMDHQGGLKY